MQVLVAGAGGFIGGHLVKALLAEGKAVRAVDIKPFKEWHQISPEAQNHSLDLSLQEACAFVACDVEEVYNLACNMGGIGFIERHRLDCMFSVLINTHLLQAALRHGVKKYFFASTACVYNTQKQSTSIVVPLREEDAYPALPEQGYGWEKLFAEQLCLTAAQESLLQVRIARLHNVYGPFGTWDGGREKAPAAICRKVAMVQLGKAEAVEIWGDGSQLRSFMFIDDCIKGIKKIMNSNITEPINLGSAELVSINQLVDKVEAVAGIQVRRIYKENMPLGVVGRNSDNTKIKALLGWEPNTLLVDGLRQTYSWVYEQCQNQL